jgi:DNA-directed RNA polymerase subunit E'/Rpb7
MSELVNPYKNTIFYTRVKLLPYQMNNELYINLKNNLKKKVERKCNKYGYVNKVLKILTYSDGTINPEDFEASAVFNIKYSANTCIPIENTKIIVKIEKMNNMAILARNGPINVVLKYDKISPKFKVVQGTILHNNKQVKAGDYLIISILAKRFYNKDTFISVYGFIDDVPTEEQIKKYYEVNLEDKKIEEEEQEKYAEYVTFNDEDNQEDKSEMVITEKDYTKQSRIIEI